jgi:DNA (cytosine-5)-methyltransferase 1
MQADPQFLVVDLFCGAGGTTTGFELSGVAKVIACVNHDPIAIKSHWANHPEVEHFEEDIRVTDPYGRLKRLVEIYRAFYPDTLIILWASLECTNFSKAKGGQPRDADSRTLADHLDKYILALEPDYVQIENVVEFMAWGELDGNGKPVSKKNGTDWLRWRNRMCSLGYYDDWRELNSADFGALTSRNRLFGCFARPNLPIAWPQPTHSKNPAATLLVDPLKKWEPVKKALDFQDEGNSVFNRKKALSTKTMQRLFMGCVKHIAGGKKAFITKWNSNNPKTGGHAGHSIDEPGPVISCQNRLGVAFITKAFSANSNKSVNAGVSVDMPCPTISVQNRLGIAQVTFIDQRNGSGEDRSKSVDDPAKALTSTGGNQQLVFISKYNGANGGKHDNSHSIEQPAGTVTTVDRMSKITACFIDKKYSADHNNQSIEEPAGTIVTNDKHSLVTVDRWLMNTSYENVGSSLDEPSPTITASRRHHYLVNPSWGGHSGSIEMPCPVVIARQDKAPLYLINCEEGPVSVPVYEDDCQWTVKLKEFMAVYGISDIKMRMLKVPELIKIQGFPEGYILHGNQTDQKKFIGNAVHPFIPKHWPRALSKRINQAA